MCLLLCLLVCLFSIMSSNSVVSLCLFPVPWIISVWSSHLFIDLSSSLQFNNIVLSIISSCHPLCRLIVSSCPVILSVDLLILFSHSVVLSRLFLCPPIPSSCPNVLSCPLCPLWSYLPCCVILPDVLSYLAIFFVMLWTQLLSSTDQFWILQINCLMLLGKNTKSLRGERSQCYFSFLMFLRLFMNFYFSFSLVFVCLHCGFY